MYDCYKERLVQSQLVKEYFMQIVAQSKKVLSTPEMKQYVEDFELKVNLDENAMIELKQNGNRINMKEELRKIKRSKLRAPNDEQAEGSALR